MHEMMLENQALQSRADDKRDRELVRQLRRDLDEGKRRISEMLGEASDLRRERDVARMEKNELQLAYSKDVEEERNQKRQLQSEVDRLAFKHACADEEKQKLLLRVEKKQAEVAGVRLEKAQLEGYLREKDVTVEALRKEVA